MSKIQLVRADSGSDLEKKAAAQLAKGWDLYGPLVVGHRLQLGQWMVQMPTQGEYRLVEAKNFTELEQAALSLEAEGFEFFHTTMDWNSTMYQWMVRYRLDLTGEVMSRVEYSTTREPHKPLMSALEDIITPQGRFTFIDRVERLLTIPSILHGGKPLLVEGGRLVDSPSET